LQLESLYQPKNFKLDTVIEIRLCQLLKYYTRMHYTGLERQAFLPQLITSRSALY